MAKVEVQWNDGAETTSAKFLRPPKPPAPKRMTAEDREEARTKTNKQTNKQAHANELIPTNTIKQTIM